VYGEELPALSVGYSGFAPGESPAVLTHAPELSTPATYASPVAVYPITIAPESPAVINYTFAMVDGELTVEQAGSSLLLSASPSSAPYQEPVTLTAVVSAVSPGAGAVGGSVVFLEGDQPLGTAPFNPRAAGGAAATFTTAMDIDLPAGLWRVSRRRPAPHRPALPLPLSPDSDKVIE
jgi:hypothetical protein